MCLLLLLHYPASTSLSHLLLFLHFIFSFCSPISSSSLTSREYFALNRKYVKRKCAGPVHGKRAYVRKSEVEFLVSWDKKKQENVASHLKVSLQSWSHMTRERYLYVLRAYKRQKKSSTSVWKQPIHKSFEELWQTSQR